MINFARERRSLSDFKRNTRTVVDQLRATGDPVILTVNGRAELVVQDMAAYQQLLDEKEAAEALNGIHRGLEDVKQGRTRPAREALAAKSFAHILGPIRKDLRKRRLTEGELDAIVERARDMTAPKRRPNGRKASR